MESLLKNRLSSVLDAKETRSNLGVAVVAKCPPLVLDETKVRQFLQQLFVIVVLDLDILIWYLPCGTSRSRSILDAMLTALPEEKEYIETHFFGTKKIIIKGSYFDCIA